MYTLYQYSIYMSQICAGKYYKIAFKKYLEGHCWITEDKETYGGYKAQ